MSNKLIYLLISFALIFNGCNKPNTFTVLNGKQIDLQKATINRQKIYFAQIDLEKFQLEIIENKDYQKAQNLQEIHQLNNSLFTFNGSFFSEKFTPTGLLISNGKELYPLVKADLLDGIFTIDQNNQPKLYHYPDYKKQNTQLKLQFAIQNGPILIDEKGEIAIGNKSNKRANRTAIGLTKDNQLVVIINKQPILANDSAPTLYEFANLIKTSSEFKNLQIHSVLNLDGGPSTGVVNGDQYLPELDKIQNIIIIKPRRA